MRKNVLITGAGGGIGVSICETLIKKYNLILVGRNIEKLEGLMKGEKFVLKRIACDLKSIDEIKKLYEKITKDNLPIDILVNNAGITDDSLFIRMNFEKWDNVIQTNLNSNFMLTNLFSKIMIKKRWGRIINITSIVGHTGNMGQANYSASKAGIIGMTKSIAAELAKWNITVNSISPGFIKTNMTDNLNDEQRKSIINKIPLGRIGSPYDVANCVKFLASEDSSYITGETVHVNGGMAML
jgi:3-oxoacyl-[acyl-carrier protein] reductase|tara:strand:- start:10373 stop:11095 length:723 start_codon:yes stop_codon:yes gene_type:complete